MVIAQTDGSGESEDAPSVESIWAPQHQGLAEKSMDAANLRRSRSLRQSLRLRSIGAAK
ncbi:MAG: hypothetical protein QXI12_00390 [Candidatus Methanomethyliaceae archaeon]